MNIKLLAAFLIACAAFAQQAVRISPAPPDTSYSIINYYSSTNLTYICKAPGNINPVLSSQVITTTAASNANPVSFTATAHGLGDYATYGAAGAMPTPVVIISGATGNWTPINGVWLATVTSADAFTIPVNSTTFGALTGTLVVSTTSPRWNKAVWSIQKYVYDASNNLAGIYGAVNPGGAGSTTPVGASTAFAFTCSTRTSLAYQ